METKLVEWAIMSLVGFLVYGVHGLKISVAKVIENQRNADEKSREFRAKTAEEIKEVKTEIKELWKTTSALQ